MRSATVLALLLGLPLTVQGQDPAPDEPSPRRLKLFDNMDAAVWSSTPTSTGEGGSSRTVHLGFDGRLERTVWSTDDRRGRGRTSEAPADGLEVLAEGGVTGGALRLGPSSSGSQAATLLVPAAPLAIYHITGRVRLADNPRSGDASSREVLRVTEHHGELVSPVHVSRWVRRQRRTHRVSRTLDPSGWDHFELTFLSGSATGTLELQLLHQRGSDQATTWYDDLVVNESRPPPHELRERIAAGYRPDDGEAARTPWRSRVTMATEGFRKEEVRDAVLLQAGECLSVPVRIPPADTRPLLRFHHGMLPECYDVPGDGVQVSVVFEPPGAEAVPIDRLTVDPRQNPGERCWQEARLDLTPVAGRDGNLTFTVHDLPDTGADLLDVLALATPRIEPAAEAPAGFNVLLIGVDTLRADRMSAFDYDRDTTPNLLDLAEQSITFSRCRSQAPWTLPSFASILTSLYPSAHGAGRGGHDEWTGIDPTTTSLAEVLHRLGYETQGIVANFLISPRYGHDQGFEAYRTQARRHWSLESVVQDVPEVVRFIETHQSTPYFLFWHIMDTHLPYTTDDEYREQFTDPDYRGRFAGRHQVPFQVLDPRPGRRWFSHEGPPPMPELRDEDFQFVHDSYDAEIAEVDAGVGKVLEALRRTGQWDRTIVVLTADHGEGLGDHHHYHHGYTLYDDQVHVPWILRIPGRDEGRVVERPVAGIDLAPTVLGALGLKTPEFMQGVDRLAASAPDDDAVILEYPTYDSSALKAYVKGDLKYLHDPVFHVEALYDTRLDPGETVNVLDQHPDFVAGARVALDEFRWRELQKGRYHLRVQARKGQRLTARITIDDLFDANFVSRPPIDEHQVQMDLGRRNLTIDTVLTEGRVELVFWGRGRNLDFDLALDGEPLERSVKLGTGDGSFTVPGAIPTREIPVHASDDVFAPRSGGAILWLEAGASQTLPVVPTPEEIELLKQLGYAH